MPTVKEINPQADNLESKLKFYIQNQTGVDPETEQPIYEYLASLEDDTAISIGSYRAVKKKVFDGFLWLAIHNDRLKYLWQRDEDVEPILIAEAQLVGRVYHAGAWREDVFDFGEANISKLEDGSYRLFERRAYAFGDVLIGVNLFHETAKNKQTYYIDSPGKLASLRWQVRVLDAAVARDGDEETPGTKGLRYDVSDYLGVVDFSGKLPDPQAQPGWSAYTWTFEPDGKPCDTADARTDLQRYQDGAGLVVDPYLTVDEQSTYTDVYCDGWVFRGLERDASAYNFHIREADSSDYFMRGEQGLRIGGTTYYLHYAADLTWEVLEESHKRIVLRNAGNWNSNYATPNVPAGSTKVEQYFYIYEDFFIQFFKWTVNATGVTIDDQALNRIILFSSVQCTGDAVVRENAGAEEAASINADLSPATYGYIATKANEFNYQLVIVQHTDSDGVLNIGNDTDKLGFRWNNKSFSEGVYTAVLVWTFDSADRENDGGTFVAWATSTSYSIGDIVLQSGLRYICKEAHTSGTFSTDLAAGKWLEYRMTLGSQFTDTTIADPSTGSQVADLNIPLTIGVDHFASDGALHAEMASKELDQTWDTDRIKPSLIIHDPPIQSGDPASPTDYLLCHLKCDENAASANLNDETANNADGTWSNVSDASDRNTNSSGDSVVQIGGGRNLDTQNGTGYIEMAVGSGTVHDASFLQKGSIIIRLKPLFVYTDSRQDLFIVYSDTSNFVLLQYVASGDLLRFWFKVGGTDYEIDTPAFTSTNELDQEMVVHFAWDCAADFMLFALNGEIIGTATPTATPGGSQPTAFYIGCGASRANPADMLIDDIKTFSEVILPYGDIWKGNGEVDTALAHSDILFYWHGDDRTSANVPIGGVQATLGSAMTGGTTTFPTSGGLEGDGYYDNEASGNNNYIGFPVTSADIIDPTSGFISMWVYINTWKDYGGIFAFAPSTGSDYTYVRLRGTDGSGYVNIYCLGSPLNSTPATMSAGKWYHFLLSWLDGEFVRFYINGLLAAEDTSVNSWASGTSGNVYFATTHLLNSSTDIYINNVFISSSPYTPQNWTAKGVPLHLPEFKKDGTLQQMGADYQMIWTPGANILLIDNGLVNGD